ncbi:hypothetical protein AAFF_G00226790 [Aldrovandia affinis]|uniref:Uncharacterized protein n=1 Tax=Aldrovandia affinis TaxID=143900 RepID=A0AAD7X1M7_9TELE|nr:hypothetical protein AAFF_G00226790 [Aldrovandia affinis]
MPTRCLADVPQTEDGMFFKNKKRKEEEIFLGEMALPDLWRIHVRGKGAGRGDSAPMCTGVPGCASDDAVPSAEGRWRGNRGGDRQPTRKTKACPSRVSWQRQEPRREEQTKTGAPDD